MRPDILQDLMTLFDISAQKYFAELLKTVLCDGKN